jgi:hypothetical protein
VALVRALVGDVGDLNRLSRHRQSPQRALALADADLPPGCNQAPRQPVLGAQPEVLVRVVVLVNCSTVRAGELGRAAHDRGQHGFGASEPDRANRDAFSHQRDAEDRAVAPAPRTLAALGKLVRLSLDVSDMDGPPLQHRSASHGASVQREGILADRSGEDRTVMGDEAQPFAVEAEDGSVERLAQLGCALRHGLEDRSDVGWRAGDHLQDLPGRRLPLQRLTQGARDLRI